MRQAFAYLRVSGKGQVSGDGFQRQLAAIEKYAAANGIRIEQVYREKGVSGANELADRPALLAMLEALAANGTKLVLIERLDRLARDLMVQEAIIGDLRKRDFELISVTEPDLLQNDPTRVLMRQIFGAIAQYEKAMIIAKLRGARQRMKAKSGRCEGRKPFGYHESERAALARITQLRAEGLSFARIAEALNSEGRHRPRAASLWHASTINSVLSRTGGEHAIG